MHNPQPTTEGGGTERTICRPHPFKIFYKERENMSTMNLTKDEVAFLNALRDPEKCAEIISVLQSYGLFPLPQQERNGKQ